MINVTGELPEEPADAGIDPTEASPQLLAPPGFLGGAFFSPGRRIVLARH